MHRLAAPSRSNTVAVVKCACVGLLLALGSMKQLALADTQPAEDEITVVGLSMGKAVVTYGNSTHPRVLRDGDALSSTIKLIKATPESALFEVNGKRRSLSLGTSQLSNGRSMFSASSSVTLVADSRGHFMTTGTINGGTVQFLVDTGATMISMGMADARRIRGS
jgi:aspartyl protease family protein